ncbi:MAG: DUF2163 domain-containing protein [Rhodospirillales bacterium]|nr:DUF2163 domain-containing protein [Rhodospirillales bacterium]
MKTSTPELRALLASRKFWSADLFTFTLITGEVLRYTSGDVNITANGYIYQSGGVSGALFEREGDGALCSWKRGLEVETLQFSVIPRQAEINGNPFLAACRIGVFDGAELTLERAYMPTYGDTSAGTVKMFVGRVAEIDAGRSEATFQIASHLELLNQQMPRNLYMPGCMNSLFDASCALSKADYAVAATVISATKTQITATLDADSGYYDLGVLTFDSGESVTVKSYVHGSPSTINLASPLSTAPSSGDGFTIYPGCDKLRTTCSAKFSNIDNFRGFPFIPQPETSL